MNLTQEFIASQGCNSVLEACRLAVCRHFPEYETLTDMTSLRNAVEQRGIKVHLKGSRFGNEGMIEFRPSGQADIVIREDVSIRRQRFTLAHEVGHWIVRRELFADFLRGSEAAFVAVAYRREKMNEEEKLVNLIAAELLLPQHAVRKAGSSQPGRRLKAVRSLCLTHQVSRATAVRRIADVWAANVLWLQLVPFRFGDLSTAAEIDDAMLVTSGESTLYAGDSTFLKQEIPFRDFRQGVPMHFAVRTPKGHVEAEFDVDVAMRPVPHAFAMTFVDSNWTSSIESRSGVDAG